MFQTMLSLLVKSLASLLLLASIHDVRASAPCCSLNYKDCDAAWCGNTQNSCENCSTPNTKFLENGQLFSDCLARYAACTDNSDGCCDGLVCKGNGFYSQCDADDGDGDIYDGDDVVTDGCCSQNYKDCDAVWCGASETQCDECGGDQLVYLEDGANTSSCKPRWSTCTDEPDSCCPGLECKFQSTFYSQCLPGDGNVDNDDEPNTEAPTSPDTEAPTASDITAAPTNPFVTDSPTSADTTASPTDAPTSADTTASPTDAPTSADTTAAPTDAPTNGDTTASPTGTDVDCEDNMEIFVYKGKDTSCAGIAALGPQKRRRKCKEGRRLVRECPSVCNPLCATPSPTSAPREPCEDNDGPFEDNGQPITCADIAALGPQKKNRKCNKNNIRTECPSVCDDAC